MAVHKYTSAAVQLGRHGANIRWGNRDPVTGEREQRASRNPGAGNMPIIAGIVGFLMAGPLGAALGAGITASYNAQTPARTKEVKGGTTTRDID